VIGAENPGLYPLALQKPQTLKIEKSLGTLGSQHTGKEDKRE